MVDKNVNRFLQQTLNPRFRCIRVVGFTKHRSREKPNLLGSSHYPRLRFKRPCLKVLILYT